MKVPKSSNRIQRFPKLFGLLLILALLLAACAPGNNTDGTNGGTLGPGGAGEVPGETSMPTAPAGGIGDGGEATEPAPGETEPAAGETETAIVPETGAETTRQPGTIQMAVVRGSMREVMERLAVAYEEQNQGIDIEIIEEPEGGAFEALIAAGNQPDIIVGSFGSMIGRLAEMNALAPLEEMEGAQELFGRLDENTVQQVYGSNYYVPMGADVTVMIYNKQLFEEAGLDPENPPVTWDEFLAAAEAIYALPARDGNKIYGTVFWNEALAWGGWYWNMLQPMYLNANQNTCQLLNRLGTDITFDDPECNLEAFFEFNRAAQQFAPPTMETNFFSRTVGMWPQYGYSWEPNLETAADEPMVIGEDVGVAPVPVPNEGDTSYTTYGGRPLMILRTTPDREQRAWDFIRFLMEDENNLEIIQGLGYLPVVTSLKENEYFQDPARAPFVEALENAIFPELVQNAEDVANAIQGVYQEAAVQGSLPPDQAVETAAERAREVLNQP